MAIIYRSKILYIFFITISTLFLLSSCEDVKESETEIIENTESPDKQLENKESKTEKKLELEKKDEINPDVNNRFFDLNGIFNPNFINMPDGKSRPNLPPQFYPGGNVQGYFQAGQNGGYQQYPNQGNFRQSPDFSSQFSNGPNQWQPPQNPNQGGFQGLDYSGQPNTYPMNRPGDHLQGSNPNWYPNQPMGNYPPMRPNEYPNAQGGVLPPVSGGLHTQVQPNPYDQPHYEPKPIQNPYLGPQTYFPNQKNQRPFDNSGFNNYPSGNGQNNQYQNFPQNPGINMNPYPSTGQNPSQGSFMNQYPYQNGGNLNNDGTLDNIPPQYNPPQNAILGKPVRVPTNTISPDQIYFEDSTESPSQTQCVQDCPATPEYRPVCGTNNVTYFNPGKFVCARNCGVRVFVLKEGVCTRRPM